MKAPEFINVLRNFSESTVEDAETVLLLKKDYPFSQMLHTLAARVSKDHELSDYKNALQLAAVYSADRAVLKEIIETEPADSYNDDSHASSSATAVPREEREQSGDVANQVIHDLQRLHQLKQNFEMMFIDDNTTSLQSPATMPYEPENNNEVKGSSAKTKKERIIELAKSFSPPAAEVAETPAPSKTRRLKKKEVTDTIINEIVVSKEELVPESDKQKEQLQIIEDFIRTQPSIGGVKEKENAGDLSTIKTGEFTDNIISETLVEILLKQGKKEKAVEVLKKLIWKFPQKKAYFAAQIEELRK